MKQRVQHMLEHGGVDHESEYRITQPDGSTRWIASYVGVQLDEHGKPVCARGVSRDITKRKIAEQEFFETQQRMELAATAANSACGCGTLCVMKFGLRTKGAPSLAWLRRKRSTSIAFEAWYILRIVNRCSKL